MVSVQHIVDQNSGTFQRKVNHFLSQHDVVKIQYGASSWQADGQGGSEFSALIVYKEESA